MLRGVVATARDAGRTLSLRPLRSLAMVAGLVLGVGSGAFTLFFTASEQAEVVAGFDRQLSPVVVLEATAGGAEGPGAGAGEATATLSPLVAGGDDKIAGAPGVYAGGELSTWRREARVTTNALADPLVAPVFGATPGGLAAAGVVPRSGADPGTVLAAADGVAWIGDQLAAELGVDPGSPGGDVVRVDGVELTVAGVTSEAERFPALGRAVVVASDTAARLWPDAEQPRVLAHVQRGSAARAAAHLALALDPTGTLGLQDLTPPDGGRLRSEVSHDVEQAGFLLSALALGIGAISVANVLSIAVMERTRELGLRSALGWPALRLARLVMAEAVLAGVVATLVGTALGLVAARVACWQAGWQAVLPPVALWLPAAAGLAAAVGGGVAPALRAGLVDPVVALRQ